MDRPSGPTLGGNLRTLRKAADLTMGEVAAAVGVADQTYARWEKDQSEPGASFVLALAEAFGVTAGEVLEGLISPGSPLMRRVLETRTSTLRLEAQMADVLERLGAIEELQGPPAARS